MQSEIGLRQKQALVGQTVEVLVEGYSKADRKGTVGQTSGLSPVGQTSGLSQGHVGQTSGPSSATTRQLVGRTRHDLIAVFDGDAAHIGALVNVRIESASPLTLLGRIESLVSPPRAQTVPAAIRKLGN